MVAVLLLLSGQASAAGLGLGALTSSAGLMAAVAALVALRAALFDLSSGHLPLAHVLLVLATAVALLYWAQRRGTLTRGLRRPAHPARTCAASWWSHAGQSAVVLPAGLERTRLLADARRHFLRLQAAWDGADVVTLEGMTTATMLDELRLQLSERGSAPNRTDVVTLHAELIGFEELPTAYLASIEYSGLIREGDGPNPVPFRELWMLALGKDGDRVWRLARQQALL